MTEFKLDMEDVFVPKENVKIEDGVYEAVIEKAHEDATPSGAEYINFWFRIRNDLNQPFKNQVVFNKIWKAKATNKYNFKMINTLGKSAQLENGKSYSSLEDLLADFIGKPLKINVKNETSEYNGKTYENTNVSYTEKTAFPAVNHVKEQKQGNNTADPFVKKDVQQDLDNLPF